MTEPVNVDVKLGINKFHVDEGHPHIIIREHPDMAAFHTNAGVSCGAIQASARWDYPVRLRRLSGMRHLPDLV